MKIKIRETLNTIIPKYVYTGRKNIFNLNITDKFKYLILPVRITAPALLRNAPVLIFYDGRIDPVNPWSSTAEVGRFPDPVMEAAGGQYMFNLQLSDPYYYQVVNLGGGSNDIGWTSGTPFYYVRKKEVDYMAEVLKLQGATTTTKGYAYINWTEDNREFILFNGYTGPPGVLSGVLRTVEDHRLLSQTMAKYLVGGTGIDGVTFYGLKQYFPGLSFGFYNIPPWSFQSDAMWLSTITTINNAIDFAADVVLSATELIDAVDLLMPSVYSSVNSANFNMIKTEQSVKLCTRINEKLQQQNKPKKQIIPFVTPMYNTVATTAPYTNIQNYTTSATSYAKTVHGINNMRFYYLPPETVMLNEDLRYETYEPIILNGGDGATIWLGPNYRYGQIRGRTGAGLPEDISIGVLYPDRKGPTGATANFTTKDMYRQSVSAYLNYSQGVCMGITGNRWWYRELAGSTVYTPPEWTPLIQNQPLGASGISSPATDTIVRNFITDTLERNITFYKQVWNELKNG